MPKRYPQEFRDDVVRVARQRHAPFAQVAADFGISVPTLYSWLKQADVDDGARPGLSSVEAAEFRDVLKRNKLLEQENEILRRAATYFAKHLSPK